MSDEPQERDRVAELIELLHKNARGGFGTVEITLSGRRFVCSLDDLVTAVRRIASDAAMPWL